MARRPHQARPAVGARPSPGATRFWLSDLPEDTPVADLVRLAEIRWRIEQDYRELKHGLGPDHLEGRALFAGSRNSRRSVANSAPEGSPPSSSSGRTHPEPR